MPLTQHFVHPVTRVAFCLYVVLEGKKLGGSTPRGLPLNLRFSRLASSQPANEPNGQNAAGFTRLTHPREWEPSSSSPRNDPGPCALFPHVKSYRFTSVNSLCWHYTVFLGEDSGHTWVMTCHTT